MPVSPNATQTSVSANISASYVNSMYHCFDNDIGQSISITYMVTKLALVIPLCVLILYLGYLRWRRQHSFATTSHSDIFTYHVVALELIFAVGSTVYVCSQHTGLIVGMIFGTYVTSIIFPGEIAFHILTCVERYLAVVHPVTYLGLRQAGGVRIRNICIGCVWLLCCGWIGVVALYVPGLPYVPYFAMLATSTVIVSFCSLRVLWVLIRPGPGRAGGNRQRVDQSKQRAFYTITAILGVLLVFLIGAFLVLALEQSKLLSYSDGCVLLTAGNWFTLPSSLVLPLLFLHRSGKLLCCHCSNT